MEITLMDRLPVAEFNRTSLPPIITVGHSSDRREWSPTSTAPESGDILIVHSVVIVDQAPESALEPLASAPDRAERAKPVR